MRKLDRRGPRRRNLAALALLAALLAVALGRAGTASALNDTDSPYSWPGATIMHVSNEPDGAGWVRSAPYLIDCPMACVRPASPGDKFQLTATPSDGFVFAGWTGACLGSANPCTLTVGATADVVAHYTYVGIPEYVPGDTTLTVLVHGSPPIFLGAGVFDSTYGRIHCIAGLYRQYFSGPSVCEATYERGSWVTLSSFAWHFYGITGCDAGPTYPTSNTATCSVQMTRNKTVDYHVQ